MHLDQGLDAGEARRPRVAALGADPIDAAGGRIGADLDAAVPLLDRRGGDNLLGRGGAEVVLNLGFEARLVAFEGEHVIRLVSDDPVGDLHLTAHGIDRDPSALELPGLGQKIEQVRDGGDLIGLLRHAQLGQGEPGVGRIGAQRVQGLEPAAAVVGAPSCPSS